MTCPRCQGLMVTVTLDDADSTVPSEPIRAWRCVPCGEILDETIAAHRRGEVTPSSTRRPPRFSVALRRSHAERSGQGWE